MKKTRIEYIDALRGFTMLLVVFAHVETFMLQIDPGDTFVSSLFLSFRMPLFFFISGYLAYKKETSFNKRIYFNNLVKRIRIQLIPTLFFGILYTYLFSVGNFGTFISDYYKFGYWFTFCLLGIFIILYINNFFSSFFTNKGESFKLFLLVLITFVLFIFKFIYDKYPIIRVISDIFCLHQICVFLPFFVFGYIISSNKERFDKFLDNQIIQFGVFVVFCLTFYVQETLLISFNFNDASKMILLYRSIQYLIVGATGICIVYNFFRINSPIFSKDTKLGMFLQTIGRRTLDIYLLHYFFLSKVPLLGSIVESKSNIIFELGTCFFVAVITIYCSLFLANMLRLSKKLSYYLFGSSNR